ncbi:MAG: hypothetical protein IJ197_05700 [Bacteroidaceae bacterium]|nr:hypothetical protein [Bacteroidaceae bacterium]
MRTLSQLKLFAVVAALSLLVVSCKENDDPKPGPNPTTTLVGGEGSVLIGATIKNADGSSGTSYFLQMPKLEGTISLTKAIQAGFASTISVFGNDVFLFPEFGNDGSQKIIRYERSGAGFSKKAERQIIPGSYPQHMVRVSDEKGYIPLYTLGRVEIVNPKTLEKTGEIDLTSYAHRTASCEPAHGIIRDGLYYLPLDQLNDSWMPHEDYRQSDVLIIDTKTDQVIKRISETESGLCFPTRPMLKGMIFTNEQNDIYIACAGYFGYDPSYLKNGFICIPAGQQEFDTSRSWDISETLIEGTHYTPSAVYNTQYLGNGIVAAYVGVLELTAGNPYTARNALAVIIDLNKRTIKHIEGIPATDGHSIEITYHDGIVYFASFGERAAGVFAYNPANGDLKQQLTWSNNISYIHFFE